MIVIWSVQLKSDCFTFLSAVHIRPSAICVIGVKAISATCNLVCFYLHESLATKTFLSCLVFFYVKIFESEMLHVFSLGIMFLQRTCLPI